VDSNSQSPNSGDLSIVNTSKSKSAKRKKARTKTTSAKELDFLSAGVYYGIVIRGKILGGKHCPNLYTQDEVFDEAACYIRAGGKFKVVKIRLTYEVISEVIL